METETNYSVSAPTECYEMLFDVNKPPGKYISLVLVELNGCPPHLTRVLSDRPLDFDQDMIPFFYRELDKGGWQFDEDQDGLTLIESEPLTVYFTEDARDLVTIDEIALLALGRLTTNNTPTND